MKSLTGIRVLVTGVGIKPVKHVFTDLITGSPSHTPVVVDSIEHKANIGAATALECARAGAAVLMVSRNGKNLAGVADWIRQKIPSAQVEYTPTDLSDPQSIKRLATSIPSDLPLYWVQSAGLGAGSVKIPDDNPYLPIDQITPELVEAELSILSGTLRLLQALLPQFRQQKETRIAIVSSMSAVRSAFNASVHAAAKGALSRFANGAMIEMAPENIFISDVRPGIVDTGMYDSKAVQTVIRKIAQSYGYDWSEENGGLCLMPPTAVGETIVNVLTARAHITSVNMVAQGQFPHEGS